MFSGGSYEEVERWLRNFVTAHAKRASPRCEVALQAGEARDGNSYGVRLRLGDRTSEALEVDYREVARDRGNLPWCEALAERVRRLARELGAERGGVDARAG